MKMITEKSLLEIREGKKEQNEIQLADIYEILINLDDRLTAIEKLNGGN